MHLVQHFCWEHTRRSQPHLLTWFSTILRRWFSAGPLVSSNLSRSPSVKGFELSTACVTSHPSRRAIASHQFERSPSHPGYHAYLIAPGDTISHTLGRNSTVSVPFSNSKVQTRSDAFMERSREKYFESHYFRSVCPLRHVLEEID